MDSKISIATCAQVLYTWRAIGARTSVMDRVFTSEESNMASFLLVIASFARRA